MIRALIAVLALIPLGVTTTLWAGSYWRAGAMDWKRPEWSIWATYDYGMVQVSLTAHRPPLRLGADARSLTWLFFTKTWGRDAVGLRGLFLFDWRFEGGGWHLIFPAWAPSAVLAAITWTLVRPILRVHIRRRRGDCVACGYNLTGNQSGVCPECGRKIEQATQL